MYKVVHYVFSTYKRKQVLTDEIMQSLEAIFKQICEEKGFEIICQSILVEHVHLLIKKKASDRNEYVMKMIKGKSAYRIFKDFPSNRFEFRKLWARGYCADEIKDKNHLMRVIAYINGQKIKGIDKRIDWKPRRLVAGFQEINHD